MYQFSREKQKGMTMLEVVVSMLIMGLGLVMAASLIQASNRYGESAEYRATAINLMESVIDTMRANPLGASGYVWGSNTYQSSGYNPNAVNLRTIQACTTNCTTEATLKNQGYDIALRRAQADMLTWLGQVATTLPGGQASIANNRGVSYTVTVMWRVNDESGAGEPQSSVSETAQLNFTL